MSGTPNILNNYGKINVTINNRYHRDSESSIPSCEVKKRKKINYFIGNGQKEWLPTQELLINEIDITRALRKFRRVSIKEAEEGAELNSLKILSLSHIFPINDINSGNCITRYLPNEEAALLKKLGKQLKLPIPRSPADAILYCKDVVDGVVVEDDNEEIENEESMVKIVKELSQSIISSNARIANSSEASFSKKYVMPFIRRMILDGSQSNVVYDWIDKPSSDKKKPDIMIGAEQKKKNYYFFFVEIKKSSMHSKYQIEDDSVKLMKEMKGSIDNQLRLGIDNPSSLGLLVEGFRCTLFRTTLLVHGVYAPIALKSFSLVKDIYDVISLPTIVEVMSFVKVELEKFIEEISIHRRRGDRENMEKRICPSFSSGFCK